MNYRRLYSLLMVMIFALSGCTTLNGWYNGVVVSFGWQQRLSTIDITLETDEKKIDLTVEVADDPNERATGLMYGSSLKEGRGMWFIFEDEVVRRFWMKNMEFPIDIMYLNSEKEIRSFIQNAQPCTSDPCEMYLSESAAQYVLEVPAGFIEENGVEVGDIVYEVK